MAEPRWSNMPQADPQQTIKAKLGALNAATGLGGNTYDNPTKESQLRQSYQRYSAAAQSLELQIVNVEKTLEEILLPNYNEYYEQGPKLKASNEPTEPPKASAGQLIDTIDSWTRGLESLTTKLITLQSRLPL